MDSTQLTITESTRSGQQSSKEREEEEDDDDDDDDEDDEKLEEEVKEMANKLKNYRSTLPLHLKSSLSSLFSSLRPNISNSRDVSLQGGESCSENRDRELEAGDGDRTAEDIKLLKDKISSNISAIPKVLKRMSDCISKTDTLVSSNETICPVFKRKKS